MQPGHPLTWADGYGHAPTSERLIAHVPPGHAKTTTFSVGGVTAPMMADGPIHGDLCLKYVQAFLCPIRKPRAIVMMDTRSSHTVDGVTDAIEATGAEPRSLPAYSLDVNPIELYFSTLNAARRTRAARPAEALRNAIAILYDALTTNHCHQFFSKAGYAGG